MHRMDAAAHPLPRDDRVEGLTDKEVVASRARHGSNVLTPPQRDPWWRRYLEKFDDPVIRILLIAVATSYFIAIVKGEGFAEGTGVLIAVLLATGLAFLSEAKANREFLVLNQSHDDLPVKAVRNRRVTTVPRRDVVVGDLVLLDQGDEIPADGEVLESANLLVMESALTGEAFPAAKAPPHLPPTGAAPTYPAHQLLRGSMVVEGSGRMRATAVGDRTEIGRTAREAGEDIGEKSPLNAQLERLSRWIGVLGFSIAGVTFAALVARGWVAGELAMEPAQWLVALALFTGGAVVLLPIWLPVAYDVLELLGRTRQPPAWMERGWRTWLGCLAAGAALCGAGVLAAGWLHGVGVRESWIPLEAARAFLEDFMVAVTLIVVAVPEGLALATTLSLAYNMRRMTATHCLVRKLDATEALGAATCICCDKTGTLTLNQMRVQALEFAPAAGAGEVGSLAARALAANSTANLERLDDGSTRVIGNPTEGALLLHLTGLGADYARMRREFAVARQWPFSAERKMMATLGGGAGANGPELHVKGAPDYVLERCAFRMGADGVQPLRERERQAIRDELLAAQRRAVRTLAFAFRAAEPGDAERELDDVAHGLVWLGFAAIADPVRPDVADAVARVRAAGIDVKVVTGDDPHTAREVARQIHLWTAEDDASAPGVSPLALLGAEFQVLTDDEAARVAPGLRILARARPADKLKLVRALEAGGAVVAVTGDGTNDAPALNHAHVGLAMGRSGTAVAREASDIVILDDSFGSIATAVKWGRSLYLNIQKFILFQLTINVAACGIALLGPFIGVSIPLTVPQMLWVNLIMDSFAALALATEPPHDDVMLHLPRDPHAFIVTRTMALHIFGTGALFLVVLVALLKSGFLGGDGERERLTIFFTSFVLLQLWNQFNARTLGTARSAFAGLRRNPWFVGIVAVTLVGQVLIVTFGGALFRVTPLPPERWLLLLAATAPVLAVGEAVRFVRRRRR